jgi:uncharacterized BrkB/YihY/UPF0761 family membrane protein
MAVAFYESDRRFAGGLLAGGLAFRAFLWLLPYSLVIVTLVGYLAEFSSKPPDQLAQDAGMSAAVVGSVGTAVTATNRGRAFLLVLGVILLIWLGRSLVRALKIVSNLAWHRMSPTAASTKESLILAGFMLLISLIPWLARPLYAGALPTDLLAGIAMMLLFAAAGLWAISLLPRPDEVPWTGLIPGGLLVGVSAEAIRLSVSLYFADKLERSSGLYGGLGLAAVFLAWLYLIGRLVIAAMNLNATLWEARRPPPEPVAQ